MGRASLTHTHQTRPQPAESYRVTFLTGWWVKSAPESPLLGRQQDKEKPETEGEQNPSDQPSPYAAVGTAMGLCRATTRQKTVSQAEYK